MLGNRGQGATAANISGRCPTPAAPTLTDRCLVRLLHSRRASAMVLAMVRTVAQNSGSESLWSGRRELACSYRRTEITREPLDDVDVDKTVGSVVGAITQLTDG